MDEATALALVTAHTQASIDPTLSAEELALLVDEMKGIDVDGKAPADEGWTPTYDRAALPSAVVQGWEMKAAKAVPEISYTSDGSQFSNSDVHKHCLAQADRWRRRVIVSIPVELKPIRRIVL